MSKITCTQSSISKCGERYLFNIMILRIKKAVPVNMAKIGNQKLIHNIDILQYSEPVATTDLNLFLQIYNCITCV